MVQIILTHNWRPLPWQRNFWQK